MNVIHVIERLGRGGAERHVLDLSAALRARGHGSQVLARGGGLSDPSREDVEIVDDGIRPLGWTGPISRAIDRSGADVLHVHSFMPLPAARRAASSRRLPVVFTVHGWVPSSLGWRAAALKACRPSLVVAVSDDLGQALDRRGLRTRVVRNGVPDANPRAEVHSTPTTVPVLLSVGRFEHPKNQRALVEAVGLLRDNGIEARLVLLGEGPQAAAVRAVVERHRLTNLVSMPGFQDPTLSYRDATVFVSASLSEGLSLAYLEALMWGLPLVVTPTSGSAAVVSNDNGVVVADTTPEALAAGIREVLQGDLPAFGHNSRALYERSFTEDVMVDGLMTSYEMSRGPDG